MPSIFNPPLSTQRYCWVQKFLEQNPQITSITDVGCGNGRMLNWTKAAPQMERINCLDSDAILLETEMDYYFRPNLFEMLFGRRNSRKPVEINVYQGDVAVPDDRLRSDCFTLVEMIEHITPEHLDRVARTIFGYYQPQFVVVTTPNTEFNHLLRQNSTQHGTAPNLPQIPNNQFRHYDHKFEWTRSEFLQWTQIICANYGYDFFMDGVGQLPGSEPFGPCTQIAIFQRKSSEPTACRNQGDLDCFDLLLNKLSVEEAKPEFLGDRKLKRICLLAQYKVPGSVAEEPTSILYSSWDDLDTYADDSIQSPQAMC